MASLHRTMALERFDSSQHPRTSLGAFPSRIEEDGFASYTTGGLRVSRSRNRNNARRYSHERRVMWIRNGDPGSLTLLALRSLRHRVSLSLSRSLSPPLSLSPSLCVYRKYWTRCRNRRRSRLHSSFSFSALVG
jgi:hypothetical protein